MIVIGKNQSMVEVARRTLAFFHEESCGKCTPCREGTGWLEKILERVERGEGRTEDIALMLYIADMIGGKSFCPFSYAAIWGLQSNLAKFRPEFDAAIAAATAKPVLPVRPIYRPDTGAADRHDDAEPAGRREVQQAVAPALSGTCSRRPWVGSRPLWTHADWLVDSEDSDGRYGHSDH